MEKKKCRRCNKRKNETDFAKCLSTKDGLDTMCKECKAERMRNVYRSRKLLGKCVHCGNKPLDGRCLCKACWMKAVAKKSGDPVESLINSWTEECSLTGEKITLGINAAWRGRWVSNAVARAVDAVGWEMIKDE